MHFGSRSYSDCQCSEHMALKVFFSFFSIASILHSYSFYFLSKVLASCSRIHTHKQIHIKTFSASFFFLPFFLSFFLKSAPRFKICKPKWVAESLWFTFQHYCAINATGYTLSRHSITRLGCVVENITIPIARLGSLCLPTVTALFTIQYMVHEDQRFCQERVRLEMACNFMVQVSLCILM